jgi:HD-GYP domain-containing protein (c-di-GMP phosphodiesterase class II)
MTILWKTSIVFLLFGLLISWLGIVISRALTLAGVLSIARLGGEWLTFLGALAIWACLCLGLAQAFGRRLSHPVKDLAGWAQERNGNIPAAYLKRQDEIGNLARSLSDMRAQIREEQAGLQDRARALEAMNRIDRAVLAGPSRPLLLDRVLESVLSYAPAHAAAIIVRDAGGRGFKIVALKSGQAAPPPLGGFVPDDLLPASLLVRFSDPFEVPLELLGPGVLERFGGVPASCANSCLFSNLPFEVTGFYSGCLILVRDAGGPGLEHVGLLADQAGVALKDLEVREEGYRNWLAVVRSLVRAIDAKSAWTRGHSERVAALTTAMGRKLLMDKRELDRLEIAAVLHDVGKIGVPEAILDKPARLEAEEMALVRRHPVIGAGIVEDLPSNAGLRSAILYHHERWDGSGYPEGLSGEDIPLEARIIALADVWDAITDERPYRAGMPEAEARKFIADGAGTLFDARLVRIFLEILAEEAVDATK